MADTIDTAEANVLRGTSGGGSASTGGSVSNSGSTSTPDGSASTPGGSASSPGGSASTGGSTSPPDGSASSPDGSASSPSGSASTGGSPSTPGGSASDATRFDGTRNDDTWQVGVTTVNGASGVYVSGSNLSPVGPLSGGENLVFNGERGDDRLSVGRVFGTSTNNAQGEAGQGSGIGGLTFDGGYGEDVLSGRSANGPLLGRGGVDDDRLIGGRGDDLFLGGPDDDTLQGNAGNDTLIGGTGEDVLIGGSGDDVLIGGPDEDSLTGGAGADVFRFLSEYDIKVPDSDDWQEENGLLVPDDLDDLDVITDFNRSEGDRIDLSAIDADVVAAGNQAFVFGGSQPGTTGPQPGSVTTSFSPDENITNIFLNTGSGVRPVIEVEGRIEFTSNDFNL